MSKIFLILTIVSSIFATEPSNISRLQKAQIVDGLWIVKGHKHELKMSALGVEDGCLYTFSVDKITDKRIFFNLDSVKCKDESISPIKFILFDSDASEGLAYNSKNDNDILINAGKEITLVVSFKREKE